MDIVKVPYKKTWTATEDEAIFRLVSQHGASNWSLIAEGVHGRSGKQCRERYHNHLQPNVKKGDWTPEENEKIVQLQKIFGNQWAKIAKELPGRTDNAVKNRWHAAMRSHCKESDTTSKSQESCKGAKKGESVVPPLNLLAVGASEASQMPPPQPTALVQDGSGVGSTPPVPPHVMSKSNAGASASTSRGRARGKSKATAAAVPSSSSSSSSPSPATRTIPSTIEEIIRKYSPRFESDMHLAAAVDLNLVSHGHHLHSHSHAHAHALSPAYHSGDGSPRLSPRTSHFTSSALVSGEGTTRGCVLAALRNSLSAGRGGDHSTAPSTSPPLLLLPGTGPAGVTAGILTDYEDDYEDAEEDFGHYFAHLEGGIAGAGDGERAQGECPASGCMSISASECGTRTGSGSGSGCDSSGSESDDSGFEEADGEVGDYCTVSGGEDAPGGEDRSSFATTVTAVSCASASSAATYSRFESGGGERVHSNESGVRDSLLLELLQISPRHNAVDQRQPPRDFSDTRSNRSASKRTDREAVVAGEEGVALGHPADHKQKRAKKGQGSCPVGHVGQGGVFSPTDEDPAEVTGGILGSCSYDVLMCDGDFDFDEDTSTF